MRYFFSIALLCASSCFAHDIKPSVSLTPSQRILEDKKAAFSPLSADELASDWGREYLVAQNLLRELDFFGATTDFKRAYLLAGLQKTNRQNEIEYGRLFSYFLAGKFEAVVATFEKSSMKVNPENFPPYDDFLVILTTAYLRTREPARAQKVFEVLSKHNPEMAKKLSLHEDFFIGNIAALPKNFQDEYNAARKTPWKAGALNAVLPGAGYLYLGHKETAVTSFLLNALFIAASYEFFSARMPAAGVISAGFECGWYFGGIWGSVLSARAHNNHLYNAKAKEMMVREKLFPILMLQYGF